MGRPPRGVNLTLTGYVLLDGTPYDPVKRKQENERAKAERKKLRKEHVEDEEQEATVADEEEEDDVEDDEAPPSPLPPSPSLPSSASASATHLRCPIQARSVAGSSGYGTHSSAVSPCFQGTK